MQTELITALKKEVSQLKAALDLQQRLIAKHSDDLKAKDTIIQSLQESLKLALAKQFGRSAERYTDFNDKQGCLFDEAELDALMAEGHIIDHDTGDVEVDIKPHKRKTNRGKRKPLPDYLPREIIEYHLTGEDLVLDNGAVLSEIGSDTSE
jgi:hypothetical protein